MNNTINKTKHGFLLNPILDITEISFGIYLSIEGINYEDNNQ